MIAMTSPKRRIVLVTSLLGGGGAERILLTMAQWWRRHEVSVLVLRAPGAVAEYAVPDGVRVVRLNLIGERNSVLDFRQAWRLRKMRQAIQKERPDLVIGFLDKLNVAVLLSLLGTGIPVVATEHLAPWMAPLGFPWEVLRKRTYSRALAVVSPTERISAWLAERMKGNFVTLPSPAKVEIGEEAGTVRRSVVAAMGRLDQQKGFDLLIESFGRVAQRFPEWVLEIAGEGPERALLERQIADSGLEGRVRLLGQVAEPAAWLASAEVFVLSSRHEAFPMALVEAMAAGCCVLATDCPTGPREILGQPPGGQLVEADNVPALAQALLAALGNGQAREEWRRRGRLRAREFSAEAVMPLWDDWLEKWIGKER